MNGYLKQSTAAQVRTIGVFYDSTDFISPLNALTINNTDIVISINGGADTVKNSGGATAHGAGGIYTLTWDATDTATVGEIFFAVKVAGALGVFGQYTVLEEAVYDALFAAAAVGPLLASSTGTGLTAIPWNANWDTEVQSECTDALNAYDPPTRAELTSDTNSILAAVDVVDNFLDTEVGAIKTKTDFLPSATAGSAGGVMISGSNAATTLASLTVTGALVVSDGVAVACSTTNRSALTLAGNGTGHGLLAESGTGATGDGLQAKALSTNGHGVRAVGVGTGQGIQSTGGTDGHGMAAVGGTGATGGNGFYIVGGGPDKHGLSAVGSATSGTCDGIKGTAGVGGVGLRAGNGTAGVDEDITAIQAALVVIDDFLDTEIAAVLADTNEMQTDWVNGGRLDLLLDAVKAKTDSLTFTVAGMVDSNMQYINDTALLGNGSSTPWGPV